MSNPTIRDQLVSAFNRSFSKQATVLINAPGRINLIGEHTDYNHGFVLPGAIDKSIVFALGVNHSKEIKVSTLEGESISLIPDRPSTSILPHWGRYFQAMLEEITGRNLKLEGVNCCFGGDIPIGAGLSSSAALCSGFLFGLNNMFTWDLPLLELAKIGQAAEHRIGANVGLMDQFAVLHGKKDNVIFLDCLDYSYQYFLLDLKEYTLVLINSNVKHALVDSAYNERRASCEGVLARIQQSDPGIKTLRDVSFDDLKSLEKGSKEDIQRVRFVLRENERVKQTTDALLQQDYGRVGELLYKSHEGLSNDYQVSCHELDLLVDLVSKENGVLGARMMGGGFGGCTINLIQTSEVNRVLSEVKKRYQQATGILPESYTVKLEKGVHILES